MFAFDPVAAPHLQQAEIEMRLGAVRIDLLGGDEHRGRFDEGSRLLRRERQEIGAGERPRRLDADGANGIIEQRNNWPRATRAELRI